MVEVVILMVPKLFGSVIQLALLSVPVTVGSVNPLILKLVLPDTLLLPVIVAVYNPAHKLTTSKVVALKLLTPDQLTVYGAVPPVTLVCKILPWHLPSKVCVNILPTKLIKPVLLSAIIYHFV